MARWWRHHVVGEIDRDAVLARLRAESGWTGRYAFMIVISAWISILGLLMPSSAVLIGAMLISPLMMPIIGLGFGVAAFDWLEIRRAALALALGGAIAVGLSALFVAVSPLQTVTTEIAARTKPNLFDLLVALLSAVAGVYALVKGRGDTVVGVAIAIALMPPLAVVGFGIATTNWTVFLGSLMLFFTNLVTIALTVAVMARLYGFGLHLSPQQTQLQGALIVLGLLALAVPLGIALRQIAWESLARRQLRAAVLAPFPDGARVSQLDIDFTRHPVIVRATILTPSLNARADGTALARARTAIGAPVDLHVDQLRVGLESAAGEEAQIAAARSPDQNTRSARDSIAERIALIAGTTPAGVVIDEAAHVANAPAAALPDATIGTYRALEMRARQAVPGWRIDLRPPAAPLPSVGLVRDAPDPRAVADAAWGVSRLNVPLVVVGARKRAEAVAGALKEAGVRTTIDATGHSETVALRWGAPGSTPQPAATPAP